MAWHFHHVMIDDDIWRAVMVLSTLRGLTGPGGKIQRSRLINELLRSGLEHLPAVERDRLAQLQPWGASHAQEDR